MITLVLGGTRSGKSRGGRGPGRRAPAATAPVTYVATGRATDADMAARIAAHRAPSARRLGDGRGGAAPDLPAPCSPAWPGTCWSTRSAPGWRRTPTWPPTSPALCAALAPDPGGAGDTVLVSEEVGLGVHPATEVGRRFADALGELNRAVAEVADRVLLVVAGRVLPLDRVSVAGLMRAGARVPHRRGRRRTARPPGAGLVRAGRRAGRAGGRRAVVGGRRAVAAAARGRCWRWWPTPRSPACCTSTAWPTAPTACCPRSTAPRRLAIMATPDVGAFGVVALAGRAGRPGGGAGLARARTRCWSPACGPAPGRPWRWRWRGCPTPATGGAAVRLRRPGGRRRGSAGLVAVGGAWSLALAAALGRGWPQCAAAAGRVRRPWSALAVRRLGGYTGDVLGAAGVIAETVGLVVAAARW